MELVSDETVDDERWDQVELTASRDAALEVWAMAIQAATIVKDSRTVIEYETVDNIIQETIYLLVGGLRDKRTLFEMLKDQAGSDEVEKMAEFLRR